MPRPDASFLCDFPKSRQESLYHPTPSSWLPPPAFASPPNAHYKRPVAGYGGKAVIQPGSCDIPAVRVQLGQFMNSGSQGEIGPVLLAHKRLLFTFLFSPNVEMYSEHRKAPDQGHQPGPA